jgi:hypothetical protein
MALEPLDERVIRRLVNALTDLYADSVLSRLIREAGTANIRRAFEVEGPERLAEFEEMFNGWDFENRAAFNRSQDFAEGQVIQAAGNMLGVGAIATVGGKVIARIRMARAAKLMDNDTLAAEIAKRQEIVKETRLYSGGLDPAKEAAKSELKVLKKVKQERVAGAALASNAQVIASTAAQGFKNLQCQECAAKVMAALKKSGIKGELVELNGGKGFMISKSFSRTEAISENGRHLEVRVGDMVYDNIHLNGIPYAEWVKDFDSIEGVVVKSITGF